MSTTIEAARHLALRVQTDDGRTRDDAWIDVLHRPVAKRLGEAAVIALGGTVVGILLLPVPLVHLFGAMFALATWWFAFRRARTSVVVTGAGGTCPYCGTEGRFYAGFGRAKYRLPMRSSCQKCSRALTLASLPGQGQPR